MSIKPQAKKKKELIKIFCQITTSKKKDRNTNILCHFDRFMSQKKMQEVLMLSETVSGICHKGNLLWGIVNWSGAA
jgi:hypothetical protein